MNFVVKTVYILIIVNFISSGFISWFMRLEFKLIYLNEIRISNFQNEHFWLNEDGNILKLKRKVKADTEQKKNQEAHNFFAVTWICMRFFFIKRN